jgi:hypothetical protein
MDDICCVSSTGVYRQQKRRYRGAGCPDPTHLVATNAAHHTRCNEVIDELLDHRNAALMDQHHVGPPLKHHAHTTVLDGSAGCKSEIQRSILLNAQRDSKSACHGWLALLHAETQSVSLGIKNSRHAAHCRKHSANGAIQIAPKELCRGAFVIV